MKFYRMVSNARHPEFIGAIGYIDEPAANGKVFFYFRGSCPEFRTCVKMTDIELINRRK